MERRQIKCKFKKLKVVKSVHCPDRRSCKTCHIVPVQINSAHDNIETPALSLATKNDKKLKNEFSTEFKETIVNVFSVENKSPGNAVEEKINPYNTYAQNYWKCIHYNHKISLLKSIKENIKEKDNKEFRMRSEKIRSSLKASTGNLFEYFCFIEPNLPWRKIKNCLKEFNINNDNVQFVIFSLKPTYIEDIIGENPFIETLKKLDKEICDSFNKKIRELSPLVGRLQNFFDKKEPCETLFPIMVWAMALQREIKVYRAIVKHKEDKKWLCSYGIDKDLKKSPQKHRYWNTVVSNALKKLNPFCHEKKCDRNRDGNLNCNKTHEKTIRKVAELLKILYPSIWIEDINTITYRIKSKYRRQLPC